MDTLRTVLRAIRGEPRPRRDHLAVFREFLAHLDRAAERPARSRTVKGEKAPRRKAKR
jgi:hypothetical protein